MNERGAPAGLGVRIVHWYYLATPLFFAIDVAIGAPIRAAAVDGLGTRVAYYAGLMAISGVMRALPSVTAWLALGESVANMTLILLAVLLPIWGMLEAADAPSGPALDWPRMLNVLLAGAVAVFSIKQAEFRVIHR